MKSLDKILLVVRGGPAANGGVGSGNYEHQKGSPYMANPAVQHAARRSVDWARNAVQGNYQMQTAGKPTSDFNPAAAKWFMRGTPQGQQKIIRNMMELDWLTEHDRLSPLVNHFGGGSEGLAAATSWLANEAKNSFRHENINERYGAGALAPHKIVVFNNMPKGDEFHMLSGDFNSPHAAWSAGRAVVSNFTKNPDIRDPSVVGVYKKDGAYKPVISYNKMYSEKSRGKR